MLPNQLSDKYYKFEIIDKNDIDANLFMRYNYQVFLVEYTPITIDFKRDTCILLNSITKKHHTATISKILDNFSITIEDALVLFEEECDWRINRSLEDIKTHERYLNDALQTAVNLNK